MFEQLIKDVCQKLNIKIQSFSMNYAFLLNNGKCKHLIVGYKFDLNNMAAGLVADDKYALYKLLKLNNIPVIEHEIFYEFNNKDDYAVGHNTYLDAYNYFLAHNKDIVLKPNKGTCGNNVFRINDEESLKEKLEKVLVKNFSISLCPYYHIEKEYRVIVLDGKVELSYAKQKPVVVGDGKSTIKELLNKFNPNYFNKDEHFYSENIDLNYIPNQNEKVEYSWLFNLSKGAIVEETVDNEIITLALEAYKVSGLRFCSVDVVRTTDGKIMIMEINSGVMISNYVNLVTNGYNKAYKVYKDAIEAMFKG